jgi:hypothetical protein
VYRLAPAGEAASMGKFPRKLSQSGLFFVDVRPSSPRREWSLTRSRSRRGQMGPIRRGTSPSRARRVSTRGIRAPGNSPKEPSSRGRFSLRAVAGKILPEAPARRPRLPADRKRRESSRRKSFTSSTASGGRTLSRGTPRGRTPTS